MASKRTAPMTLAATALAVSAALPVAAQTVVRDAETGQLRAPNAAEAQALRGSSERRALRSTLAAPSQRALAHGAVSVELDESTLMYSVARRNADGSVSRACVQGEESALQAMKKPANFAKPLVASTAARTARGAVYEDK